jgi:hypothetical protein
MQRSFVEKKKKSFWKTAIIFWPLDIGQALSRTVFWVPFYKDDIVRKTV